jgi:hypothetical protein
MDFYNEIRMNYDDSDDESSLTSFDEAEDDWSNIHNSTCANLPDDALLLCHTPEFPMLISNSPHRPDSSCSSSVMDVNGYNQSDEEGDEDINDLNSLEGYSKLLMDLPHMKMDPKPKARHFEELERMDLGIDHDSRYSMFEPYKRQQRQTHVNVTCNGCSESDIRTWNSKQKGFRSDKGDILGVRYMSFVHPEFDLCEACERLGIFQSEFGPFVKIVDSLNVQQPPIRPLTSVAPPSSSSSSAVVRTPPKCTHTLESFETGGSQLRCDLCFERRSLDSNLMKGCLYCNYVLCLLCCVTHEHQRLEDEQQQATQPQATLIHGMDPDDVWSVSSGESLVRIWKLQNSGIYKWPDGTKLQHVSGHFLGGPIQGKQVPSAEPGQLMNVTLDLKMPTQHGRYSSHWRLMTQDGIMFGPRLSVVVNCSSNPIQSNQLIIQCGANDVAFRQLGSLDLESSTV